MNILNKCNTMRNQGVSLTKICILHISIRWYPKPPLPVAKEVVEKGGECIGKACNELIQRMTTTADSVVNSTDTPNTTSTAQPSPVNLPNTPRPLSMNQSNDKNASQQTTSSPTEPKEPTVAQAKDIGSVLNNPYVQSQIQIHESSSHSHTSESNTTMHVGNSQVPGESTTTFADNVKDRVEKHLTPNLDELFKVSVPSRNPVENPSPNNSSTSSGLDTSVNSGSIQSISLSGQQFGVFGHAQSTGTRVATQQTVTVPSRGMASVHGGRYTEPLPKVVPTLKQTQQEETHTETGVHKIIVVVRCNHEDCLKTDCANDEITPCNIPQEKHQEEFSQKDLDKNKLVLQSAGNTTSSDSTKLPDKQVVQVDANKNYADQPKAQNAVIEQTTVPLNPDKFQEQKKVTAYLQDPDRSAIILTTLNTNTADETI